MAATYGELKTEVKEALNRADLTARIPKFIAAALQRVNLELAAMDGIVDQEQTAYADTAAGVDSLSVPTDFMLLRYIKVGDDPLESATYDELIDRYGDAAGTPEQYAIFDGSFFFRPIPDSVKRVRIGYIKKYGPLSADLDSNWLLTNGGNLLLYAACLEAMPQMVDDPRMPIWAQQYKESMRLVVEADRRATRGVKPAGVIFDGGLPGMFSTWNINTG